jgi:hypothetical protein
MSGRRAIVVLEGKGAWPEDGVWALAAILGVPDSISPKDIDKAIEKRFGRGAWWDSCDILEFVGAEWRIEDARS